MKMIHVLASIHVKENRLTEFFEILKSNISNVLGENGCIEYTPTADIAAGLPNQELDKNVVTIIEKWRSLEDLQTHLSAPHMIVYKEKVKDLVDKVTLKVLVEL